MKNSLKWPSIIGASILGLFLLTGILLHFFLPLNAIKDYAAIKLSEQLHHDVKISGISFNIFSGIKLKGVTIANAKGFSKDPMVSADTLELKYVFWPLFRGKVIIPEINFVKPEILIEKDRNGNFNFGDMLGEQKKTRRASVKPKKNSDRANVDLIINNFRVTNGKILYKDHYTGSSGLKDVNLAVSNITLIALKPVDIRFSANGVYDGKTIPISLAANIGADINGDAAKINSLDLTIAGDTLHVSADMKGLKTAPKISISASSSKIAIDPFLAIFSGAPPVPTKKETVPHGALTKSLRKTFSSIPSNVTVQANLDLKNILLKTLKVDALALALGIKNRKVSLDIKNFEAYKGKLYSKGFVFDLSNLAYSLENLELHGFTATLFINDVVDSFVPALIDAKNNIEGSLDVSLALKGSGIEMPEAFENLKASGVILLSKGRIKKMKSLASIGEQYNINMLKQDIIVGGLRINASIAGKMLKVGKLSLSDTDLQTEFQGTLDFNKMEYIAGNKLNLKLSPSITKDLPRELSIFRDDKGFVSVDFELQGSLYKPIPSPLFQKPFEAVVGKLNIKIEAKKVEIETKVQQQLKTMEAEAKQKAEEEQKRLEKEAKKKIKEIFRF